MKLNTKMLKDYRLSKGDIEVYLYLKTVDNLTNISLTKIREDLNIKIKDVNNKKQNIDYIIRALYSLKRQGYLIYKYSKDFLHITFTDKEKEDQVEFNRVAFYNIFTKSSLTNIEKRLLCLLFVVDTSKNRKELYKHANLEERAVKLNIKKMHEKHLFTASSIRDITRWFRVTWKNKANPLDKAKSILNS